MLPAVDADGGQEAAGCSGHHMTSQGLAGQRSLASSGVKCCTCTLAVPQPVTASDGALQPRGRSRPSIHIPSRLHLQSKHSATSTFFL